ncbi:MAG: ATP:cob(I)alamin adenosyltransferase, partial [Synergistaceae bacterium]|nr:ATP:cob(I)alamin adenosyltransferase [Synergistaceae bacterium]
MKDDSMTNLYGPELVSKTDPRIELRGKLDELNARIILLQTQAGEAKNLLLYTDMDIIHKNF